MAITTGTLETKTLTLGKQTFIFAASLIVTGDASGGTIEVVNDLKDYLPLNGVFSLLHVRHVTTEQVANIAMSQHFGSGIAAADRPFELPLLSPIHGNIVPAASVTYTNLVGTAWYSDGDSRSLFNLPLYLGRRVTTTVRWTCHQSTNTNTKSYNWEMHLLYRIPDESTLPPISVPVTVGNQQIQSGGDIVRNLPGFTFEN